MTKHTNNGPSCPSCESKLLNAHPTIAEWFKTIVKPFSPTCHVSWSWRGKEDQEQAFLDGKSKLHFPNSMHNKLDDYDNPCSMALDLFELDGNGMACWHYGFFRDIAQHSDKSSARIIWGGTWKTISDNDHFQMDESKDS